MTGQRKKKKGKPMREPTSSFASVHGKGEGEECQQRKRGGDRSGHLYITMRLTLLVAVSPGTGRQKNLGKKEEKGKRSVRSLSPAPSRNKGELEGGGRLLPPAPICLSKSRKRERKERGVFPGPFLLPSLLSSGPHGGTREKERGKRKRKVVNRSPRFHPAARHEKPK